MATKTKGFWLVLRNGWIYWSRYDDEWKAKKAIETFQKEFPGSFWTIRPITELVKV